MRAPSKPVSRPLPLTHAVKSWREAGRRNLPRKIFEALERPRRRHLLLSLPPFSRRRHWRILLGRRRSRPRVVVIPQHPDELGGVVELDLPLPEVVHLHHAGEAGQLELLPVVKRRASAAAAAAAAARAVGGGPSALARNRGIGDRRARVLLVRGVVSVAVIAALILEERERNTSSACTRVAVWMCAILFYPTNGLERRSDLPTFGLIPSPTVQSMASSCSLWRFGKPPEAATAPPP